MPILVHLVQPRAYFLPIFAHLVWARIYFLAILVKEMSNFGNSCKETNIFFKFWSLECKNLASFAKKMPTHGTFDVEISLAKGIIFRKIGLANGAILKLWAAHPCPKFSREPPPPRGLCPLNSIKGQFIFASFKRIKSENGHRTTHLKTPPKLKSEKVQSYD